MWDESAEPWERNGRICRLPCGTTLGQAFAFPDLSVETEDFSKRLLYVISAITERAQGLRTYGLDVSSFLTLLGAAACSNAVANVPPDTPPRNRNTLSTLATWADWSFFFNAWAARNVPRSLGTESNPVEKSRMAPESVAALKLAWMASAQKVVSPVMSQ